MTATAGASMAGAAWFGCFGNEITADAMNAAALLVEFA